MTRKRSRISHLSRARLGLVSLWVLVALGLPGCASKPAVDEKEPEDGNKIADLNTRLAIVYMRDGDNELALKKLDKAIDADPAYAPAYSARGLLYNRVGAFDDADENFRKALRLEPDNSSILNNYGQVLCQHGQHAKGQEMFLKANQNPLYPTPEIALNNAGTCAMAAGDAAAAEKHFREALKINPRIAPTLLQMARISYDLGRHLSARAYLQRYLEVGKQTAQSLWLGIQIERVLGDKDALASYSLQLEKAFPDAEETRLLLESTEH
jgi:type IV pilus assembly protein PilF